MKKIAILIVLISCVACKDNKKVNDAAVVKSENELSTFGFLEEADGCSCYFARTQEQYDQKKFIYADNYYDGDAFIAVDGKQVKVNLKDTKQNTHKIKVEFNTKEQLGPESWKQTGTLEVTLPNGKVLKEDFVGTCGC